MPNGTASLAPASQGQAPNALQRNGSQDGQFSAEKHVQNNWEQAQVQHKQLMKSQKTLDSVRRELDRLTKLGDTVTAEDVIKGAGTLVGTGLSPGAMAQLLSTMPPSGGEALQAWVEQQDQMVRAREVQLQQQVSASAVHRGLTAMSALHVDHIKQKFGAQPQGSPPPVVPSAMAGSSTPMGPQSDDSDNEEE